MLLKLIFLVATSAISISAFFENINVIDSYDYETDVFFEILHPKELGYTYRIRPATSFGVPLNDSIQPFKSKLVPTDPALCCEVPRNSYFLYGNIALVERGHCAFKQKAINAEAAGARGIIIADHDRSSDMYIDMLDDDTAQKTSIPAAFLLGEDGYMIRKTLRELEQEFAEINIPLNITKFDVRKRKQPPWIVW